MRNLVKRVGPKTSFYHLQGMGPNSQAALAMLQNITIYYIFATLAPQKHPRRSILAIFGPTMSATPQFGVQIGPNLAPYRQYLKPIEARKGYHEPPMSVIHPLQVTRFPEL